MPPREDPALAAEDPNLAERLAAQFGAECVRTTGLAALAPEGSHPCALLAPATAAEAAAMLAFARRHALCVAPIGGGTRRAIRSPARGIDLLLSTARLNRVLEYVPADFIITAQSGVTLAHLREVTAANGQWLALDPPAAAASTLGGALSADASGPHRYLYGTSRDLVVGIEVALPRGDVIRSGGRVVKNVAGYDLKKLFLGALGSLGVITSVSLKLHAIPEDETLIIASFPDYGSAGHATAALLRAGFELAALDLLNREALEALGADGLPGDTRCGLLLSLVGSRQSNEAQSSEIAVLCARSGSLSTRTQHGEACRELWLRLENLCLPAAADRAGDGRVTVRLSAPLRECADMARRAEILLAQTAPLHLVARAGNGVLTLYFESPLPGAAEEGLRALRGEAIARGGSLVLEAAPAALRSRLDVPGASIAALPLHQRIKEVFDPDETLLPGSFSGNP